MKYVITLFCILSFIFCASFTYAFEHGALMGDRYRIIVSTDIGGGDEDDDQSMVHYLLYSDLFDTEGLISSPPKDGRKKDILEVIDAYEKDYENLSHYSKNFPRPDYLRSISKQGAEKPSPEKGFSQSTEGSDWIIQCAKKDDPRPLYILVWGSITDIAQAVHDAPEIKEKIRVYCIASWNRRNDPHAHEYLKKHHSDLWIIDCETTFRGWYVGGEQGGDLGNRAFVEEHARKHGALGSYFYPLKNKKIKMGDTPSVSYLLMGDPADPTSPSWGGRFMKAEGFENRYVDLNNSQYKEGNYSGAKTINRWREDYLRDFKKRFDWCLSLDDIYFEEKDGLVAVETEHYVNQTLTETRKWYPFTVSTQETIEPDGDDNHSTSASGRCYLEILPDTRRSHGDKLIRGENFSNEPGKIGILSYPVRFNNPGRYYMWVRSYSTTTEGNGLHVGLDSEWPESGQRLQWCDGKHSWCWESKQRTEENHCGEPFKIYLDIASKGMHTIHFSMREDGFEFDKWFMTKEKLEKVDGPGPDENIVIKEK